MANTHTHIHTQTLKNFLFKFDISAYFIRLNLSPWFKVNDTQIGKTFICMYSLKNYHIIKWTFKIYLKLHVNNAFINKMLKHKIQDHITEEFITSQMKHILSHINEHSSIILRLSVNGCMYYVVHDLICCDTQYIVKLMRTRQYFKN